MDVGRPSTRSISTLWPYGLVSVTNAPVASKCQRSPVGHVSSAPPSPTLIKGWPVTVHPAGASVLHRG